MMIAKQVAGMEERIGFKVSDLLWEHVVWVEAGQPAGQSLMKEWLALGKPEGDYVAWMKRNNFREYWTATLNGTWPVLDSSDDKW